MTDIITDEYNLEITIIEHADVQILDVVAPDCVEANEDFEISYEIRNDGETDSCFGRVIDTVTNSEIAGSRWDETIMSGSNMTKIVTIPGSDVVLNLRIEVGYVK
jgi:hypothetical protein